jgi:hypothetical protein
MKRISIYIVLLLLSSSFLSFSWAMEEDSGTALSTPHPKKSNKKGFKWKSFWKKPSKKRIQGISVDTYLAKGRRKSVLGV